MGATTLSSRAIIGSYYEALAQNKGAEWVPQISMPFDSNQESETYPWLGMSPAMREWIGGRNAKGFRENGITIVNKHFEATMEVAVQDLKRDKTSQILLRIQEMADRTNAHWASLLSTLIIAAEAAVCYDGQYFFDTDHSEGDSGTQSNDLSIDISALPTQVHGSTTAPSAEEMSLCVLQAISAILGFKDDQGEPMNEGASNFLVMVPISLLAAAQGAVTAEAFASGGTNLVPNLLRKSNFNINVVANARLTWTAQFAVFRTDGRVKPFICQEEEPVVLKAIAEGSEMEFTHNKHQYGVDCWRNVGSGYWQHACLVTMT
jgi:phage major head subunit gpT-like protein